MLAQNTLKLSLSIISHYCSISHLPIEKKATTFPVCADFNRNRHTENVIKMNGILEKKTTYVILIPKIWRCKRFQQISTAQQFHLDSVSFVLMNILRKPTWYCFAYSIRCAIVQNRIDVILCDKKINLIAIIKFIRQYKLIIKCNENDSFHLMVLQWLSCTSPIRLIVAFPIGESNPVRWLNWYFDHGTSMLGIRQIWLRIWIMHRRYDATNYFEFIAFAETVSCDFCD